MRRPGTSLFLTLTAVLAVVALAACSSDSDSSSSTTKSTAASGSKGTAKAIVVAGDNAALGTIVVDNRGRTVYTLTDTAGKAVPCTGSCLQAWPPVLGASSSATGGRGVTKVSTVTMSDGEQVTIGGLPVYTFSGDRAAGEANGDGISSFGGTWHVVKVSGSAAGGGTTKPTSSTTSGYGY
jgi:predicted lipoprotein with Yx(FWY)xxD motif